MIKIENGYKWILVEETNRDKEIERLNKEIERLKELWKTDIESSKEILFEKEQEIERLNNIINESSKEILKELKENHHLSYGVALSIRQKLLGYKELNGSGKE